MIILNHIVDTHLIKKSTPVSAIHVACTLIIDNKCACVTGGCLGIAITRWRGVVTNVFLGLARIKINDGIIGFLLLSQRHH